ncbi:hypothetical protein [Kitasatospora purpeofusca]|uniref:hypothetical protein n=1 Tax=Kitasatospora purpeofusca TaxID=67352 RepID=UPI0036AF66A0
MSDSTQSSSHSEGTPPSVTGSFSMLDHAATVAEIAAAVGPVAQVAIQRGRERTARHREEQVTERARIDADRQITVERIRTGQDGDRS